MITIKYKLDGEILETKTDKKSVWRKVQELERHGCKILNKKELSEYL